MSINLGKAIADIGHFFSKLVKGAQKDILSPVVVAILQGIKTFEDDGLLPAIAAMLDKTTNHLSVTVNDLIKAGLLKAIALQLAISGGISDNPTDDELKEFSKKVAAVLLTKKDQVKGETLTNLGVKIYTILGAIHPDVAGHVTFGQITTAIESAYQAFLKAQADLAAQNAQDDDES